MAQIIPLKTSCGDMDCIVLGNGKRAYMMLPGITTAPLTGSADAIEAAYKALTDDYTIYLFDRPKKLKYGVTAEDMANAAIEGAEKLGLKDIYLSGASQGGMMAQYAALTRPELIKCAVFVSSPLRHTPLGDKVLGGWAEMALKKDKAALAKSIAQNVYGDFSEDTCNMILSNISDDFLPQIAAQGHACTVFDISDKTKNIKCPSLVIGTKNDMVFGYEGIAELAKILNCEMYTYEKYDHALYDQTEDFKTKLKDFFDKH